MGITRQHSRWRALRREVMAAYPPVCSLCGGEIDLALPPRHPGSYSVHHLDAIQFGGQVETSVDRLRPAHYSCNASEGSRARSARKKAGRGAGVGMLAGRKYGAELAAAQTELNADDYADSPVHGDFFSEGATRRPVSVVPLPPQKPNEAETREIPPEQYETPYHDPAYYQAPRIETPTPANCGGSYGPEAIDWIERWADVRLFPWQEHWLNRALEYDAETGDLLWGTCLISAPRQSGKSVGLRAMALWRLYQGERWGEQTVFHVSPNRSLSREIWKKAAAQVQKYDDAARVRWANGQEAIELPDDSQWILGAANETSAPGLSISLAVLDEAWAYGGEKGRAMLEEAIAPATLHRRNAQIFLVSTAGTLAAGGSNLLRDYRDRAIGEIATPPANGSDLLIVEWSAPPDADMDDEATWRQAQAIWDPGRLERLRRERGRVKPAAFASQLLNIWSRSFDGFITAKEWDRIETDEAPPAPQVVALETDGTEESGLPIGAVEVAENDGRYHVTPRVFYSYAELADYLRELGSAGGVTVVHHKSMLFRHDELPPGLAFEHHRGVPDQQAAYARVREAITTGAVIHNGNAALTEQMLVAATHTPREGTPHLSQNKSDGPIYLARALMVGVLWAMTKQKPRAMVVAA